jgi:hypothetical protein
MISRPAKLVRPFLKKQNKRKYKQMDWGHGFSGKMLA